MHIHGAHIVIVGPGAAHNFHEKANFFKNPSWTDIATVVCTRGLRTSGKVRVEYDDETILQPDVEVWACPPMARRTRTTPRANGPRTWPKRSKWSAHVAKAGIEFRRHMESPSLPAPPNLLDTLLALGEYTTIVDVIYNHYDRFGKYLAGLHRA